MIRFYPPRVVACLLVAICPFVVNGKARGELQIETPDRTEPVDFNTDILPLLRSNCLACHSESEAEGDLVLESASTARLGGSSGPAVVPGNSAESYLLQLAAHRDEPIMPPEDNDVGAKNLTPAQLGLLKLWIDQGAKDGTGKITSTISFRALPKNVDPILAATISADGRLTVCSRGNRLFVYETVSGQLIQELIDPELRLGDQPTQTAHLDLVQSLAIDPSTEWIASGGFRNVKLWQRQDRSVVQRVDLAETPTSLALDSDSRQVAVALANGAIRLISLESAAVTHTLNGHTDQVHGVAFLPNGRLVSTSADKTIRVWNISDGQPLSNVPATSEAKSLVVAGDRVVTGHDDHVIRVWKLGETGELISEREISGHGGPITSLAVVPSRPNEITAGSADQTVRIWNLDNGQQLKSLNQESPVLSVAVDKDGSRVLSTSDNRVARLWNVGDGQKVAEFQGNFQLADQIAAIDRKLELLRAEIGATKGGITELEKQQTSRAEAVKKANEAIPAAEKELADRTTAAADATAAKTTAEQDATQAAAALAEVDKLLAQFKEKQSALGETGNQLQTGLETTRNAAARPSEPVKTKLDEVSQLLQTIREQQSESFNQLVGKANELRAAANQHVDETKKKAEDATKKIAETEKAVKDSQRKLDQAKLNAEQRQRDNERVTADLAAKRTELTTQESHLQSTEGHHKTVSEQANQSSTRQLACRFSPTQNRVAVATETGDVYLYDAQTGTAVDRLSGHQGQAVAVIWAGDKLLSIGADKQLIVWSTQLSWKLARTIGGVDQPGPLSDRVLALDFNSEGKLLAAGSGEPSRSGSISVWNTADGTLAMSLPDAHSDTVFGVEFSPDDQQLASCGADRMAKVFSVADGTLVRGFEGHTHHVLDVSWQANGKSIATAGADKVIKIWNAATGEQRRTISGINKEVTSVAYAGISANTISSSGDTNIRIHKSGDGGMVRSMDGGGDFVYATAVSDDGKRIVSGGVKSILRVWNADDGKLIKTLEPLAVE